MEWWLSSPWDTLGNSPDTICEWTRPLKFDLLKPRRNSKCRWCLHSAERIKLSTLKFLKAYGAKIHIQTSPLEATNAFQLRQHLLCLCADLWKSNSIRIACTRWKWMQLNKRSTESSLWLAQIDKNRLRRGKFISIQDWLRKQIPYYSL